MRVAITIIARNEAEGIGGLVAQLAKQTLLATDHHVTVLVVANGCDDNTAELAEKSLDETFSTTSVEVQVHDTPLGGKARSWNLAVHDLIDPKTDLVVFLDADIELANIDVLAGLIEKLDNEPGAIAVSGYPVKDIATKSNKSLIDRFSLKVSAQTPAPHSINGSLYVARMGELRKIWLPVPTPGEDGMLSAMIHTDGFTQQADLTRIERMPGATHYFAAHAVSQFFRHEQRMTVGTVINGWLFEHFWEGKHAQHVGPMIAKRNAEDPDWVERLIARKVAGKKWALPSRMLTWRLHNLRDVGPVRAVARAPFSLAATILNLWPSIQANRTLKKRGSAGYW